MATSLPSKVPIEVLNYSFDFAARLAVGDTIQTVSVTITSGSVACPSALFSGSVVSFWLSGGAIGQPCIILVSVTTTLGETIAEEAVVYISS